MADSSGTATIEASQQPETVINHLEDIAVNKEERKMCVNLPGRQKFQYIFCEDGEKTIKPYNAVVDLDWSPTIQPTVIETQPDKRLAKMLVVGLVVAENPLQHSLPPAGFKSTERTEEKKAAPIVQRPDKYLCVFVRHTEFIERRVCYYVAVQPINAISRLRTIAAKAIFFLPEFVPDDWDEQCVKAKFASLNVSCKTHAAKIKSPKPSRTVSIEGAEDERK